MTCKDCIWFYQETFDDGRILPSECLSPDAPSWVTVFCSPDNPSCCSFDYISYFAKTEEVTNDNL